jgi:hypothetical protein
LGGFGGAEGGGGKKQAPQVLRHWVVKTSLVSLKKQWPTDFRRSQRVCTSRSTHGAGGAPGEGDGGGGEGGFGGVVGGGGMMQWPQVSRHCRR